MTTPSDTDKDTKNSSYFDHARDWNTRDFTGKYHYSRLGNKETPIWGTQVQVEKTWVERKAENEKRFEDD